MRINGGLAISALLLLGGCVTGLPWAHKKDANAAATVADDAAMIGECRRHFTAEARTAASGDAGPTVIAEGKTTTIRFEATLPPESETTPAVYSCDFDNGKLVTAGPDQN